MTSLIYTSHRSQTFSTARVVFEWTNVHVGVKNNRNRLHKKYDKYSFFPRTISVWNGLPFSMVHASSVNLFKASIVLYFISFLFLSAACVICYSSPQHIQFNVIYICLA